MLLVGWQGTWPVKTEWWGDGMVICLERGADLHIFQLMPLPLTVCCFSKIQIGFAFLVPAHLCSSGKRAVKRVCVCFILVSSHLIFYLPYQPTIARLHHSESGEKASYFVQVLVRPA